MLFFSNENGKILFYLCYIINISSSPFHGPSSNCIIENESVIFEPEFVNTNSQINSDIQGRHPVLINKIETFECVPLDLTQQTKETIICNLDQQSPLSLLSNTQEDCPKYAINKLSYDLEDISSSEQSEENDVETIDTNDGNKHSYVIEPELENNQIVNPTHRDQKLQKYFEGEIFKPYMSEKSDVSCSKTNKRDYDTTQFNPVPLFSERTFTGPTFIDSFRTNHGIHENVVLSRPFDYKWGFTPDPRITQYFTNPPIISRNINPNIVAFKDPNYTFLRTGTISDTTRHLLNTNKDSGHFKHGYPDQNFRPSCPRNLLTEPPRKILKHISTVVEDSTSLVSSTSKNIITTDKDITDTINQLGSSYTFFPPHNPKKELIKWCNKNKNTQQQTFNDTDLKLSHQKPTKPKRFFQILMKGHDGTNNDETSLKKISGNIYNLNFILKNTLISWSFNRIVESNLFLALSCTPFIATDIFSTESIFGINIKTLKHIYYSFSIPIFHTVEFICSNNINYFRISVSTDKYGINQTLKIYVYSLIPKKGLELRLKCPRIHDFKELIKKLLDTKFPIYPFPVFQKLKIVQFPTLYYYCPINEMTINEYIKDIFENPLNIKPQEYNRTLESHIGEIESNKKYKVCWETGVRIVYDVYKTFNTNITEVLKIIDDNSMTFVSKKVMINDFLKQIIQKIKTKINYNICYPRKIRVDHKRESELMSFYAFYTKEVLAVLEWWNKYVFVVEEIQYIPYYLI